MPQMQLKNGDDHAFNKLEAVLDQQRRACAGDGRKWNLTLTKTGVRSTLTLDYEFTPEEIAKLAAMEPSEAAKLPETPAAPAKAGG